MEVRQGHIARGHFPAFSHEDSDGPIWFLHRDRRQGRVEAVKEAGDIFLLRVYIEVQNKC